MNPRSYKDLGARTHDDRSIYNPQTILTIRSVHLQIRIDNAPASPLGRELHSTKDMGEDKRSTPQVSFNLIIRSDRVV